MQRICFYLLSICGIVLFLTACSSSKKDYTPKINKPILYNPTSSTLHPELGVFHVSDTESQLYVMIGADELLVNEANPERVPKADIRIHYQLYDCTEIENNKEIADSATFVNSVEIKKQQKIIVFPIMFAAKQDRRYMLLVQTTDLMRRNTVRQFLAVNKTDVYSTQNFKLTALNGSPKLGNMINENDVFRIIYQRRPIDSLYIKYSAVSGLLATSPSAPAPVKEADFKADSVWTQPYSAVTNFMFGYEGLYLIQTDTSRQEGLLLVNFGPAYPNENRTDRLIQPIRYLTTPGEYRDLCEEGNPKKTMDKFWLSTTGSTDKSRMLIRVFYTRIAYANRYFTDFKEGWKTDRGMIYLIYGLPSNVLKGSNSETWEYNRKQQSALTFVFDKKPSPYTESYYVLRRNDPQPAYWSRAVDSWRKGKVFNIQDLE